MVIKGGPGTCVVNVCDVICIGLRPGLVEVRDASCIGLKFGCR